jgi:hypothetical protein
VIGPAHRTFILAEREGLVWLMRRRHELNRIEGLRVEAVDFVHLSYSEGPDDREG